MDKATLILCISACTSLFFNSCLPKAESSDDTVTPPPVSSSPAGTWQRYGSPKGYQTDISVGNITGQPANRVYMCEHPGSPTAGLYKGTISGNTITWDAAHHLPNAEFKPYNNEMTLYFGVGPVSDAAKYKKGVWTNTCGRINYPTRKIAVGIDPNQVPGITITGLWIDNIVTPMQLLAGGTTVPDCSSPSGYIVLADTLERHSVLITYKFGVSGSTNSSAIDQADLTGDCNLFRVYDNTTLGHLVYLVKF